MPIARKRLPNGRSAKSGLQILIAAVETPRQIPPRHAAWRLNLKMAIGMVLMCPRTAQVSDASCFTDHSSTRENRALVASMVALKAGDTTSKALLATSILERALLFFRAS